MGDRDEVAVSLAERRSFETKTDARVSHCLRAAAVDCGAAVLRHPAHEEIRAGIQSVADARDELVSDLGRLHDAAADRFGHGIAQRHRAQRQTVETSLRAAGAALCGLLCETD